MNDFDLIKDRLSKFSEIEDNKLFIQYLIIKKCISILEFAQEAITNGKGSLIAPQLREVFEYTIILAGLDELVPLSEFINHEKNDRFVKKIRDRMEGFALIKSRYEGDIFKGFTKMLYDTLSEHTHANIDNLMRFTIDEYSSMNDKSIFQDDAQVLFDFVNSLFLMGSFVLLKIEKETKLINEKTLIRINQKLKPDKLESNDVYNRILAVEGIRLRYINKIQDLKKMNDLKSKE